MKKKFEIIKTLQLCAFIAIAAVGLYVIFTDSALYQMVGRDPSIRILCLLLWIALGLSFICIFWDFSTHSSFKKEYGELDFAVYHDRLAGIANRYSCDAMIEKYLDRPLPDTIGCVMLDIVNIRDINETHGHAAGNEAILVFSGMLRTASPGLCFVGRNGGNKFLALFEDCSENSINTFLARVARQVEAYNMNGDVPAIEYRTGRAMSKDESADSITRLISLADRRLTIHTDRVAGIASRAGCDDIIGMYLGLPLPETIGCVMLEISNLRQINETCGHIEGNRIIRLFGDMLREAAAGLCFVGRNGGMKFLALFEDCEDDAKIEAFIAAVEQRISRHNALEGVHPIRYRLGKAFREGPEITGINQLVALSDRRLREKEI